MNEQPYDSRPDTLEHIQRVQQLMLSTINNLMHRALVHDKSKLEEPEKSAFDKVSDLKKMDFGSPEYNKALEQLGPALKHHYKNNDHHPQWSDSGIDGMNLLSLLEMICDWDASASRTQGGGDIRKSLEINTERFKISPQLKNILANTIREMGW